MSIRTTFENSVRWTLGHAILGLEKLQTGVVYNPFDAALYSDPYRLYRRLRERDPIHRSKLFGGWVVTRYEDVLEVLKDPRMSSDERNTPDFEKQHQKMVRAGVIDPDEPFGISMLRSDAPDHTRLRTLVNKGFTPRSIQKVGERVQQIVDRQLDRMAEGGRVDLIRDFAYPVPVVVIAEMIGVPSEDQDRFKAWSDDIVLGLGFSSLEDARRSNRASRALGDYFRGIAEERRREPRDDLMSALLLAEEDGDKLTARELFDTLNLLLIAGNETTTNLIGNGMLALLQNPEQLERLRKDSALTESAIEELLRYDSPVQATSRIALEDVRLGGETIEKGQQVLVVLGAANRDPERFEDPDLLDLGRDENRHLAFGHGVHFCLGSNLARMEGALALRSLIDRFPNIRLDADAGTFQPSWRQNIILHGLDSLPVKL